MNLFLSVLNLVLGKGLRLVAITLAVRQMGPESWGQATATFAFLTLIGLVVSQGLGGLPQIYRVNERALDRPLLFNITAYRLLMAALVIAALHLLAPHVPAIGPHVLLYAFVLIPRALSLDWLFHRRERYHLTLGIAALRAVIFFGLIAGLVGPESSARTVILADLVSEVVGTLAGYLLLPRAGLAGSPRGGSLRLGVMLLAALPLWLTEALHTLTLTTDILILRFVHGYQAVAEYDIGAKIGMAYFFVGAALVQIVLPKLGKFHATGDYASLSRVLSVSSALLLVLGALLLLPSFYFADEVVRLLFDKDYADTVLVFQWVPVWVYASFMTMLNVTVLLAVGKRKLYFYGALIGTAVNVTGYWFLIREFAGPGAVAARLLGELVLFAYAFFVLPAAVKAAYRREVVLQFGLLAALVGIHLTVGGVSRPVGLGLSLLVCGAVFWRRRVFSRATLQTLRSH
ncbi:MAG TPA: polysaccharide biosynthesis C-terminal domain-containing protein [Fibrobacteria bacterium]|nr:polysaccharide biosynthesis C-terminal domain-containing protein [Fibrobacteria bacterium]